jgi:hypothetical protein
LLKEEGSLMPHRGSLLWVACLSVACTHLSAAQLHPAEPDRTIGRDPSAPKEPAKDPGKKPGEVVEPAVRRLDHTMDGWSVVDSANFRVFHHQAPEFAEQVARAAERARTAALRKWFGQSGGDWAGPCEVYLHATAADFRRATGAPAGVPGATTIRAEGGHVVSRRIDLSREDSALLAAVLPHETTHAVLAGRFGDQPVPPWANEGMAILDEPEQKIHAQLGKLPGYLRGGELFTARQLLQLKDYPERRSLGAFYSQSVSLVDFLAREKGPDVFSRFVRDGLRDGYDRALRRHYGWGLDELDVRWRGHVFGEGVPAPRLADVRAGG